MTWNFTKYFEKIFSWVISLVFLDLLLVFHRLQFSSEIIWSWNIYVICKWLNYCFILLETLNYFKFMYFTSFVCKRLGNGDICKFWKFPPFFIEHSRQALLSWKIFSGLVWLSSHVRQVEIRQAGSQWRGWTGRIWKEKH